MSNQEIKSFAKSMHKALKSRGVSAKLSDVQESIAQATGNGTWRTIMALKQQVCDEAPANDASVKPQKVLYVKLSNGDEAVWLNGICLSTSEAEMGDICVGEIADQVAKAIGSNVTSLSMRRPEAEDWTFDDVYEAAMVTLAISQAPERFLEIMEEFGLEVCEAAEQPGRWLWSDPTDVCEASLGSQIEAIFDAWMSLGFESIVRMHLEDSGMSREEWDAQDVQAKKLLIAEYFD